MFLKKEEYDLKTKFIFLLLLVLIPLKGFALTQEIELTLQKEPEYIVAVTSKAISSSDTTITEIPKDITVDTLSLSYDKSARTLEPTTAESYYVSYIFCEYNKCTLTAQITRDLLVENGDINDESDTVPFQAVVTGENSASFTLDSTSCNTETVLEIKTASTKLQERKKGSLELQIKPLEGYESVNGKSVGKYTSTIVFTVSENA